MPRHTYRMTADEYRRYIGERDPLAATQTAQTALLTLVRDNPGQPLTDGSTASVVYDAGWFWVVTTRPVSWM